MRPHSLPCRHQRATVFTSRQYEGTSFSICHRSQLRRKKALVAMQRNALTVKGVTTCGTVRISCQGAQMKKQPLSRNQADVSDACKRVTSAKIVQSATNVTFVKSCTQLYCTEQEKLILRKQHQMSRMTLKRQEYL